MCDWLLRYREQVALQIFQFKQKLGRQRTSNRSGGLIWHFLSMPFSQSALLWLFGTFRCLTCDVFSYSFVLQSLLVKYLLLGNDANNSVPHRIFSLLNLQAADLPHWGTISWFLGTLEWSSKLVSLTTFLCWIIYKHLITNLKVSSTTMFVVVFLLLLLSFLFLLASMHQWFISVTEYCSHRGCSGLLRIG